VTEAMKIADAQKAYATDGRFDMEGFRNVLQLRADMLGTWGGKPPVGKCLAYDARGASIAAAELGGSLPPVSAVSGRRP